MTYFSERESGEAARTETEITAIAWRTLAALIGSRIDDGSFGAEYPEPCPDGCGPCGTHEQRFWDALVGQNPTLMRDDFDRPGGWILSEELPPTLVVLDAMEFCYQAIGLPQQLDYHSFFRHYHLRFDRAEGQSRFQTAVNDIFRRNWLAFEMINGEIRRMAPAVLREALAQGEFATGDHHLDTMLGAARRKFLDPHETVRREALEKLWDAWERIKTLEPGRDKKAQANALLDKTAGVGNTEFRQRLENEARELTAIGNDFMIRHTETSKVPLANSDQVDYLFHRLFALIRLILRTTGRPGDTESS